MRIGVNARLLVSDRMEGIPRYIFETTRAMAVAHPEDTFVLFFDRRVSGLPPLPPNIRSVVVPWHARHPVLWHFWLEYMLPLFFRWWKIDVFYSGDGYLSLSSSLPTVMAVHDLAYLYYPEQIPASSRFHYRWFIPRYLKKACHILTVSDYVRSDISHHFPDTKSIISVAGNAVDPDKLPSNTSLSPRLSDAIGNAPYFLYVGAVHPRKNIRNLLTGFALAKDYLPAPFKMVIAGRLAWKTNEISEMMNTMPGVVYAGSVSEEEKIGLLQNATAVTYVSLFEGFGIPILEAMACGTPVITSSVTSMPEVAGGAALLADPLSPASIARQMKCIATKSELREKLILLGYERCKTYSWHKSATIIYGALTACKAATSSPQPQQDY